MREFESFGNVASHSALRDRFAFVSSKRHNVRVIPDAGDVEIVAADTIAKLSAETSTSQSVAAWDQRIVVVAATRVNSSWWW